MREIFEGVWGLVSLAILEFLEQVIFRVAHVVATAEKGGVRVGWLDKLIGEIYVWRDHFVLTLKDEQIST